MRQSKKPVSLFLIGIFSFSVNFLGVSSANAEEIDVSYLQTCLKEEGSSLDVLVLMDASASLRDSRPTDSWHPKAGSDPQKKRGKILKSSLKILQTLASESQRPLNINLRTFGKNSDPKEQRNLEEHSVNWSDASQGNFDDFINKALYDESTQTEWANALASAKNQFKQKIGKATLEGKKSCPIMFWITDGAPTDSTTPICASGTNSSIDWFRESNVLVLGGLLKPKDAADLAKASQFRPIVTGDNCGRVQPGWTRGEVIEANDIGDLAWGFVGLVASIKNLIDLKVSNSGFYVDPGSSHIEIFLRSAPQSWSIRSPDGKVFCSSESKDSRCKVISDSEIGIVTIALFPDSPAKSAGNWTITPRLDTTNIKVYGSLNTASKEAQTTQPRMIITPKSGVEIEEGESADFEARIVNADGSDFAISGFKNVSICAKVASAENQICKSGSNAVNLAVNPSTSDKSVSFEAILTSSYDDNRNYRIAASQKISVIQSGIFPSLQCEKNPCKLKNLKNKSDKSVNILQVKAAKNGDNTGKISLVGFSILSDEIEKRGDGHFKFEALKTDGERLIWPTKSQFLSPGEKIKLSVSTDLAGDSEINGILKYKVYVEDKEITRQLQFRMNVGHEANKWIQLALLLLAYIITIGIPYAFLLWSARKAAVLNVLYNEVGFVAVPFEIGTDGKIRENENYPENSFTPDYTKINNVFVEPNSRQISIGDILVEVLPPKWNPFSQTKTLAKNPKHYLFSTFGRHEVGYESTPFHSSLLDEAIFYFAADGNICATNIAKQEFVEEDSKLGFLESSYETKLSNVVESPSGPVRGMVIFLVSPYVTSDNRNKEKSLAELAEKLKPILSNFEFTEIVAQLREQSLKEMREKVEAEKKLEKAPEQTTDLKNLDLVEEDDWGGGRSTGSKISDLPEPRRNDDSW